MQTRLGQSMMPGRAGPKHCLGSSGRRRARSCVTHAHTTPTKSNGLHVTAPIELRPRCDQRAPSAVCERLDHDTGCAAIRCTSCRPRGPCWAGRARIALVRLYTQKAVWPRAIARATDRECPATAWTSVRTTLAASDPTSGGVSRNLGANTPAWALKL